MEEVSQRVIRDQNMERLRTSQAKGQFAQGWEQAAGLLGFLQWDRMYLVNGPHCSAKARGIPLDM